jgi:hypothetical protein
MPAPRQDFHRGLRESYARGRGGDEVVVQTQRRQGVPVAPGMGGVQPPPGHGMQPNGRSERSASKFGPVVGSRYGGGSAVD